MDTTDPFAPIVLDTGATLQAKMTDNGEPGASDTLAITVWNGNGSVWFASHWDGQTTAEQTFGGGNLTLRAAKEPKTSQSEALAAPAARPVRLAVIRSPSRPNELAGGAATPPWRFQVRFRVVPETEYALERSTDLVSWTHLTTVMSFTDELVFFDQTAVFEGPRFYRVRGLETSPRRGREND